MTRQLRPAVAAIATDLELYARFVDIWRDPPKGNERAPVAINDIAWELGIGQAKAAITMKVAEQQGWVRRVGPRTEQYAYEPTEKALAQWPESGVSVMPDEVTVTTKSGAVITSVPGSEARSWRPEKGFFPISRETLALPDPLD